MLDRKRRSAAVMGLWCVLTVQVLAQAVGQTGSPAGPAAVVGAVSDPSGAKVAKAVVHAQTHVLSTNAAPAVQQDATTDASGSYSLALPPGVYDLTVVSDGFSTFFRTITVAAGGRRGPLHVDAKLAIATADEQVNVSADNGAASTSADDNKSALVFKGSDLKTFSDDDDTFQKQILALAGNDGENAPSIYVDGFSGGKFPPKNSIREIRINQNPYSAQYEDLGYGRVEILTKPGSDQLRGFVYASGNFNGLNTTNPYAGAQPPYHSFNVEGNLSGPLGKKTSFFASASVQDEQVNAVVNAVTLNAAAQPVTLSQAVPNPSVNQDYTARLDRQINDKNTFIGRYEFTQSEQQNSGIGLLVLPSQGVNTGTTTQNLQLSNTQTIGTKMVSETRFQYTRTRLDSGAISSAPSIIVQGAFTGGGNGSQQVRDDQDRYEFQEYLSRSAGKHFLRLGARYRFVRDANLSTGTSNGQYVFSGNTITADPNAYTQSTISSAALLTYQITQLGVAANKTDAQIRATCQATAPDPVTQQRVVACGGASQFSLTAGTPNAVLASGDLGVYADDEWKVRKNVTVNLGLRLESQSAIPDHADPAPRVGFAWNVGQTDKRPALFTLRAGAGLFYQRFSAGNLLTAVRQQSGTLQRSYFVQNPSAYPAIPSAATLTALPPTLYSVSPALHAAYQELVGVSVERPLGKFGRASANYLYSHSVHQYNSQDINAPLPGTYTPGVAGSGTRPLGGTQDIDQFSSNGVATGSSIFFNVNANVSKKIFFFAFYGIRYQNQDAFGAGSFPTNEYNLHADYGRSASPTQRLFSAVNYSLPFGFDINPFISVQSGAPFNITTGTDLNGDNQYNDRPAFATDLTRSSVVKTKYGNFDTLPTAGQQVIPINYGNGPMFFELDLNLRRGFHFGPLPVVPPPPPDAPKPPANAKVEKPERKYALNFGVNAANVLNRVNRGTPVGILSSPFFGQSISLNSGNFGNTNVANRTINLSMFFAF